MNAAAAAAADDDDRDQSSSTAAGFFPCELWELIAGAADTGADAWRTTSICRASFLARSSCDVPASVLMRQYGAESSLAVALQWFAWSPSSPPPTVQARIIRALIGLGANVTPSWWTVYVPLPSSSSSSSSCSPEESIMHAMQSSIDMTRCTAAFTHTPLTYAISELASSVGDSQAVVFALLDGGADANARGVYGLTPLMLAAMSLPPATVIMERLLQAPGIDVDARAPEGTVFAGRTALSLATDALSVYALADAGADVNSRDSISWTPLMHAVGVPSSLPALPVVCALLHRGADANARAPNGRTPLMLRPDCPDVVAVLLAYGALPELVDDSGSTALMHLAYMFHCLGPSSPRLGSSPPLEEVYCCDDVLSALLMMEMSRDSCAAMVSAAHAITGKTALMNSPSSFFARALVQAGGAPVDQRDACGVTALMYAAFYPHTASVVGELMNAGADVNAQDMRGCTALMYAACNPDAAAALLHDPSTDADARDASGNTALILAVAEGSRDVVEILLTKRPGLDLSAKSRGRDGMTAAMLAAQSGRQDILGLLLLAARMQAQFQSQSQVQSQSHGSDA